MTYGLKRAAEQYLMRILEDGPATFTEGGADVQLAYLARDILDWEWGRDIELQELQIERDKVDVDRMKAENEANSESAQEESECES